MWVWTWTNDIARSPPYPSADDTSSERAALELKQAGASVVVARSFARRFFRGAMPPTLRSYLEQLIREQSGSRRDQDELALLMIGLALASPYYGVIK